MSYSAPKPSRVRLIALLLVAIFSFAAIGASTIASATDATAAKKKKCKKGYKKVGKKCKKIAAKKVPAASKPGIVTGVQLYQAEVAGQSATVMGDVKTTSGFVGTKVITYTAVTAEGSQTTVGEAKSVGGRTEVNFTSVVTFIGAAPVQITAEADGKSSNTLTVN